MDNQPILVLATRNKNKLTELQATLNQMRVEVRSAFDFAHLEEVDEDQPTLEGNALKKARYTAEMTGLPSLSDDTGLEVDALGGRPGVYSARYAGENASYADNVQKLIRELSDSGVNPPFTARFRTVIAFVDGDFATTFNGVCEGQIMLHPRGSNGFGYDPVFVPNGYSQTFAEIDPDLKNTISHRGKAIKLFRDWLTENPLK
jgi:XTP/dITP diphosphohydrolase